MRTFHDCKYGLIALGLSLVEVTFIWGSLAVVFGLGAWGNAAQWLGTVFGLAYLAGFGALAVALLGLGRDLRRGWAGVALVLGLLNLVVCGIPIAGLR